MNNIEVRYALRKNLINDNYTKIAIVSQNGKHQEFIWMDYNDATEETNINVISVFTTKRMNHFIIFKCDNFSTLYITKLPSNQTHSEK